MRTPLFIIKWTNYEYWPWWFFYIPMIPYWLWLAIKTKSFTYFSATNTNMELGGFFGESKANILKQIPEKYLPLFLFIKNSEPFDAILSNLKNKKINYPIVAKPNVGERGYQVEKINSNLELKVYHESSDEDYIIQEYVTHAIELGIMYYKLPDEPSGKVSSITMKEFLSVTGDGKSSILQLMKKSNRARFQIRSIKEKLGKDINNIPNTNETILLEPIGNHCRGTKFLNGNNLINEKLHTVFNDLTKDMKGFYYGRFDLKVKSVEDLYEGNNIKILELNGASSEPGHIYDPSYSLIHAYKDLAFHWKVLSEIAIQNIKKGVKPVPVKIVFKTIFNHFN